MEHDWFAIGASLLSLAISLYTLGRDHGWNARDKIERDRIDRELRRRP